MWMHTIGEAIPSRDLLLAVTEQDEAGRRYYIARVRHRHVDEHMVTDVGYLPLPDIPAPKLIVEDDGSVWLDESCVEIDIYGVARLMAAYTRWDASRA